MTEDVAAHRRNCPPAVVNLVELGEQAVLVFRALLFRKVIPVLQRIEGLVDEVFVVNQHQRLDRFRYAVEGIIHFEGID